ncbi:LysE family translocator [Glycomyces endophyticus]|uniref:LysE family translocator n=1 Tax=Glycomyces endophyticus TaxID=480996 RepID=A0ABP4SKG6_9ACTN
MWISPETLLLFCLASLPIVIAPGTSVAFVVTTTFSAGWRAGLPAVAGVEIGYLAHVVAAAVGVSALIVASPEAFTVVKLLGAAYLIWLGVKGWLSKDKRTFSSTTEDAVPAVSARQAFTQGLVVGVLNPKTAVFFLAFLPQFVSSTSSGAAWQIVQLGIVFVLLATIPDSTWVLASNGMRRFVGRLSLRTMARISGTAFFALAAYTLFA